MVWGPTSLFLDGYPVVPASFIGKAIISWLNGLDAGCFVHRKNSSPTLRQQSTEKTSLLGISTAT